MMNLQGVFKETNDVHSLNSDHTRVFILCAGSSQRWNNYLGIPKQLASIGGESLLWRTVRILHAFNLHNIYVVTNNRLLTSELCYVFTPHLYRYTCETLLSTDGLWGVKNLILLGDVYYSCKTMYSIVTSKKDICFFGRPHGSAYTKCKHGELFAVSFAQSQRDTIINSARATINLAQSNLATGNLWNLYDVIMGFPIMSQRVDRILFHKIDDITDDVDTPSDYHNLDKTVNRINSQNAITVIIAYVAILYRRIIVRCRVINKELYSLFLRKY
jgi:GTP:adenosylcobinamide-phosphate guanylyltransferase